MKFLALTITFLLMWLFLGLWTSIGILVAILIIKKLLS